MIRWLKSWRRRRVLVRTHIQLEALRRCALTAPDFMFRDQQIFLANALLVPLHGDYDSLSWGLRVEAGSG